MLCPEISNLARQLKINPEVGDNHPVVSHLPARMWFRNMELTIIEFTVDVVAFVTSANETAIAGFRREHAKGELRLRKSYEILRILSPCWEKKYMVEKFYTGSKQ